MIVAVCRGVPNLEPPCGWQAQGNGADKEAEKHTKASGHATSTIETPDVKGAA